MVAILAAHTQLAPLADDAPEYFSVGGAFGNHALVAAAPTCMGAARLATCDDASETPVIPTARQRLARMLEKAGYSHSEIADKLGIRHRQAASRLLARAKRAEAAFRQAVEEFVSGN